MKTTFLILAAATLSGLAAESVGFPFQVSGKKMPAGKYEVREGGTRHALLIAEVATGRSFFVIGASAKSWAKTMLNFNRYGDKYVLTSVTNDGALYSVPTSRRTAEVAQSEPATENISIAIAE